jgi:hypothetical protein
MPHQNVESAHTQLNFYPQLLRTNFPMNHCRERAQHSMQTAIVCSSKGALKQEAHRSLYMIHSQPSD